MTITDGILVASAVGMLLLTAWYKGMFGHIFERAPISTQPTSIEETGSEYYYVRGARMAMQEAHDEAARRLATKQRQEVIDSIVPPLPPSGSQPAH